MFRVPFAYEILVTLLVLVCSYNAQEYPSVSRKEFDCELVFDDSSSLPGYFPSPYTCHEYYICQSGYSYIPKKVTCGPLDEDPTSLGVYYNISAIQLGCGQAWRADPASSCYKPYVP